MTALTADELRLADFDLCLHLRLAKGGWLYRYVCRQHPRLMLWKRRASRDAEPRLWMTAGSLRAEGWRAEDAAEMLADDYAGGAIAEERAA